MPTATLIALIAGLVALVIGIAALVLALKVRSDHNKLGQAWYDWAKNVLIPFIYNIPGAGGGGITDPPKPPSGGN